MEPRLKRAPDTDCGLLFLLFLLFFLPSFVCCSPSLISLSRLVMFWLISSWHLWSDWLISRSVIWALWPGRLHQHNCSYCQGCFIGKGNALFINCISTYWVFLVVVFWATPGSAPSPLGFGFLSFFFLFHVDLALFFAYLLMNLTFLPFCHGENSRKVPARTCRGVFFWEKLGAAGTVPITSIGYFRYQLKSNKHVAYQAHHQNTTNSVQGA